MIPLSLLACGAGPRPDDAWIPEGPWVGAGYTLATNGDLVLVGMPFPYIDAVAVLDVSSGTFADVGVWTGEGDSYLGSCAAIGDPDRDGVPELAIGAPENHTEATVSTPLNPNGEDALGGSVYLVHGLPARGVHPIHSAAAFTFRAPSTESRIGADCEFATFGDKGEVELVVSGGGAFNSLGTEEEYPGGVFALAPSLSGEVLPQDASRTLRPDVWGLGNSFAAWDGDGDGIDDLVVQESLDDGNARVNRFASPWVGDLSPQDATTQWTAGEDEIMDGHDGLGKTMDGFPDLTGDGKPDLAMGAHVHGQRVGAVYVVEGGDLAGGPASDLLIQYVGSEVGEGVGTAIASGDIDGDGEPDLVVGAGTVYPGELPGEVVVFAGPLGGRLDRAEALWVVRGEHKFDSFGWQVEVLPGEGDGPALLVGAYTAEEGKGAVYLLPVPDRL